MQHEYSITVTGILTEKIRIGQLERLPSHLNKPGLNISHIHRKL